MNYFKIEFEDDTTTTVAAEVIAQRWQLAHVNRGEDNPRYDKLYEFLLLAEIGDRFTYSKRVSFIRES